MPAASEYVVLGGGLTMPVAPMLLMLDLERRGFQFERDGDDIIVRPFSHLTEADRIGLRRWKPQVLALLDYRAPEVA
jgi:hypothetical protein